MTEPLSTMSGVLYALVGVLLAATLQTPEMYVLAAALGLLSAGTIAFHAGGSLPGWAQDLDHAGMNATFTALATYAVGAPWYVMLVGAVAAAWVLEYTLNYHNYPVIGILVWMVFAALFGAGQHTLLLASVLSFGLGFYFWNRPGDFNHMIWHMGTAAGLLWATYGLAA